MADFIINKIPYDFAANAGFARAKNYRRFKPHSGFMSLGGSSPVFLLYSCLRVDTIFFSQPLLQRIRSDTPVGSC
jgi:hypothetical protein